MIFSSQDLRQLVISDTLHYLGDWTQSAENLLLGTAIQESGLGFCLKTGRRLGLYHITPSAHRAVWDHYLVKLPEKASRVRGLAGQHSFTANPHIELITNLRYATAIAWCIYLKAGCKLAGMESIEQLAEIWHSQFHNQPSGSTREFIRNYRELGMATGFQAA